jgi:hypothetical protein
MRCSIRGCGWSGSTEFFGTSRASAMAFSRPRMPLDLAFRDSRLMAEAGTRDSYLKRSSGSGRLRSGRAPRRQLAGFRRGAAT